MQTLLHLFGILSFIGAIIALVLHFGASRDVQASGILISMFVTGLLQFVVLFALAEILQKLDSIIKRNKDNDTLTVKTKDLQ